MSECGWIKTDNDHFMAALNKTDEAIAGLLTFTRFLKVEDFHDLSYIRERLQILRKEHEHAAARADKEEKA